MITDRFEVPARLKTTGMALTLIGILTVIAGAFLFLNGGATENEHTRFWIVLLHNSVFFLMISVASVFIQAAAALAQGSWIVAYKRVPEAIGANVWVFGIIAIVVLFSIVFGLGDHNPIYHWVHPEGDEILEGKSSFLNKYMFAGFTLVTVGLWSFFGRKFRAMSLAQQNAPKNSTKLYWKVVTLGGVFLLVEMKRNIKVGQLVLLYHKAIISDSR